MSRTPDVVPHGEAPRIVYIAAWIASLGGLIFGYDFAVISGSILFIRKQFSLSPTSEEIVVTAAVLGALVGAAATGPLADRFGRRTVLILTALVSALGALASALAPTATSLIIGRLIAGVSVGATTVATPLYISEVSPQNIRGRLVSFYSLVTSIGILFAYLVDYAFSTFHAWRWMFSAGVIPAALLGIGMMCLPETPHWLASHGLVARARTALQRMRQTHDVEDEIHNIELSLRQHGADWRELLSPGVKTALIVGIGLAICRSATGFSILLFYGPTILELAGFESASIDMLATVGVGVIFVLMNYVVVVLVDRVGRRPLLLTGLAGMAGSFIVLGLAFVVPNQSEFLGWIAAGSLMLMGAFYRLGPAGIIWLLLSEIYPLKIRGRAMSIATATLWSAYILVSLTFLTLIQILGRAGTFWLYGLLGIAACLFVYFLVPETKGRSLEEIQAHWRAGKGPRAIGT